MYRKLDKVDLKIIRSLIQDGRKPVTQLAKEVGVSRPTAINRLKKLISENILSINAGVNIGKLGFRMACLTLEVKGVDNRQQFEKFLMNCPRVLTSFRLSGKSNLLITLFGENPETLMSTIESFRDFLGVNIIDVNHSEPSVSETFSLQVFPEKSDISPCGKKCSDCFRYQNDKCLGCPVVTEYLGSL